MTAIQPPGIEWVVNLTQMKLRYSWDLFNLRVQSQEKMYSSWTFHVDDRSESSRIQDMITGIGPRSSLRIRHTHELQ
jgi:hypothetical protein